jgi:hypothetical protein
MTKTIHTRLEKLEQSATDRGPTRILTAATWDEAAELQEKHPGALVIVTGVPRSARGIGR